MQAFIAVQPAAMKLVLRRDILFPHKTIISMPRVKVRSSGNF